MHDHFDYWSRITPEREFGIDVARRLSYADAAVEVARLCSALHGAGIGAGCRLAIISRNRIEYALVSFAASKLGAVVVPVNVRLAAEELRFVLSDAGARCAFVDAPFQATLAGVRGTLSELGCVVSIGTGDGGLPDGMIPYENFLASASAAPTARRAQPSDDAVQYYTSGTTGKPKGVVHGHIALAVAASYWRSVFPIGANERQLLASPAFHPGGFLNFLHTSLCGASVYFLAKFDAYEVLRLIAEERLVHASLVPTTLDACLAEVKDTKPDRFGSLRYLSYGASPISAATIRRALEVFPCEIHQHFGLTEAPILTHLMPQDHLRGLKQRSLLLSTGRPVVGCEIRILDDDGQELPVREPGEICARTPLAMKGYHGRPEATAETLRHGWLHTGDIGFLDEEGYLRIIDRKKDMIVSGSENVFAGEVEHRLLGHPAVHESAVIGVPSERGGEEVKAIVVLTSGQSVSAEELMDFCGESLAGYKRPRSVDFVSELPRNANGKVLKRVLREPYWEEHSRRVS